jgi:hypothetical protein
MNRSIDAHEIVSAIHQSVTTKQRLNVLHQLFRLLGYDEVTRSCDADSSVFLELTHAGVINSLCLQLGFVLHRHGSSREELGHICFALELFYTHCPHLVTEESLKSLGSDLFQLLLSSYARGVVLPVLSTLHATSGSNYGTLMLLQFAGLLPILVEVLQKKLEGENGLMETLGLLKNVTFYGEDHRQRFVEQPGLLSTLTRIPFSDANDKAQERLSAVFRNIAISPDTRILLAQQPDVLSALARLTSYDNRHTLRNTLNTLVSLAMDGDSCLLLVFHGDGILIEAMKRLVTHDGDEVIRKRAARALRLMARDTSAPLLVHDTRLMETLSNRALHDTSNDVRIEAAEAFARCAGLIKAPMAQHEAILDALTHLANSPSVLPEVMARALKDQASHPENRVPMAQRNKLLEALARIATSAEAPRTAKEDVCLALLDLCSEEENQTTLATPPMFNALVQNAVGRREDHRSLRESSIQTLLNLALIPSNRNKMANHASLLQALLQFAAATADSNLKKKVKAVILQLAAEL